MRCNQVTIKIERFSESCPKNYPNDIQEISVYCDSYDNIYTALSKAFSQCINELSKYEKNVVCCDVSMNENQNNQLLKRNLLFKDTSNEYDDLKQKLNFLNNKLWIIEHAEDVIKLIKESKNVKEAKLNIQKKYGLDDDQIELIFEMSFDLLIQEDVDNIKNKRDEIRQQIQRKELVKI